MLASSNFRSTPAATIEVNKYNAPNKWPEIYCTVVNDYKFQIFETIFSAHLLMRDVLYDCVQTADIVCITPSAGAAGWRIRIEQTMFDVVKICSKTLCQS